MRTISVAVSDTSELEIGSRIYMVSVAPGVSRKILKSVCPVCGDAKKVEVNGYVFDCPLCVKGRGVESVKFWNFEVREFIVHRMEIRGPERMDAYPNGGSAEEDNLPRIIEWSCFTLRDKEDIASHETRYVNPDMMLTICRDNPKKNVRYIDAEKVNLDDNIKVYAFYDREEAEVFCKRLNERQKLLLDEFNKSHGTSHEFPFV